MKRHLIRTLSLAAVFALLMTAMSAVFMFASAKDVDNTLIFNSSNAENITEYSDAQTSYLAYRLSSDSKSVTFRRNLALRWFSPSEGDALVSEKNYFSLTLGFVNSNFDSFTVAMESSQFSMSKDEKTTNEVVFTKQDDGSLAVSVNGTESGVSVAAADMGKIEIAFSEDDGCGNFTLTVNEEVAGAFTNIGRYYSRYASASATTPLTPLTFKAEGVTGDGADFNVQELNGQSLAINESGDVQDNTPPALVVNNDIRQFFFGTKISLDTLAIDVCNTSGITTDEYYYYPGLNAETDPEDENATLTIGEGDAARVYAALDSDTLFFPETFGTNEPQISIAYSVTDGDKSANYLIDWSAQVNGNGFIDVLDANDVDETPATTFITYTKDDSGNITLDAPLKGDDDYDTWYEQNIKPYQDKVTAAAYKDGDVDAGESIQVGEDAYYYIPAFKEYVQDSTCGYTDMEFTVYYRTDSSSSVQTVSGSYDELRIELTAEGRYQFRIVPTNSAGNAMVGIFASGPDDAVRYSEDDITTDNVFEAANLVTFEFTVQYTGPSIEKPEDDDDTGYVDATYTVEDFEIVGISGSYTEHYRLYYFEAKDPTRGLTPSQLRTADENGTISELGEWKLINKYDDTLDEDDENNDNDYSWNPDSSLSFVPQERGFYKVELIVTSDNLGAKTEAKYIEIAADADVIRGETYWLENNIWSLVFLGIGVLCLIGIVVILLIKPKDKAAANAESARKAELKEKRDKRK